LNVLNIPEAAIHLQEKDGFECDGYIFPRPLVIISDAILHTLSISAAEPRMKSAFT